MDTRSSTDRRAPDRLFAAWRERGDAAALAGLFDATAADLFRLALTLAPDPASAEDALQETFLVAVRSADRHDPGRPVVPWLVGILRHKVEDLRRRGRRAPDPRRMTPPVDAGDPVSEAERKEREERVHEALEGLDEPYRSLALLRWRYGLEPAEIAHLRREKPGTVRMALSRALAMLRVRLGALAGVLVGLREREARGLAFVRREVLRAAAPVAAAGAGAAAAAVTGGLLMGKKVVIAAAAVLLLAGAWAWIGGRSQERVPPGMSVADFGTRGSANRTPDPSPTAGVPPAEGSAETAPPFSEARLRGRVVDEAGAPVPGARVASLPSGLAEAFAPRVPEDGSGPCREARTGEDGRFEVALVAGHPLYSVYAEAAGRSPASREGLRPGEEVEIVLEPACHLAGTVRDMESRPVAGAQVRWLDVLGAFQVERSGTSGEDGSYRVDGVPSPWESASDVFGKVARVEADGFAPLQVEGRFARVGADGNRRLDLYLGRGATLNGRVVSAATGRPIEGARVFLWTIESAPATSIPGGGHRTHPAAVRPLGEHRTGPDGTFSFSRVPAWGITPVGIHTASPEAPRLGMVLAWAEGHARLARFVGVPGEGEEVEIELRLRPSGSVRGRVVDADGSPAEGARVHAYDPEHPWERWGPPPAFGAVPIYAATTDSEGEYLLEGVGASTSGPGTATVSARFGETSPFQGEEGSVTVEVRPGAVAVAPDLVLVPSHPAVSVEVLDEEGSPVWGARVAARESWGRIRAVTGREGRCVVSFREDDPALAGGAVRFEVRARGFAPALSGPARPAAEDPPTVQVTLRPGRRVTARVRFEDGRPAAGVPVEVSDGRIPVDQVDRPGPHQNGLVTYGAATAGPDGSVAIEDLPEGPYHLTAATSFPAPVGVERPWVRAVAAAVPTGARDVVLTFPSPPEVPPGAEVGGTVVDALTGRPVLKFSAMLSGEGTLVSGRPVAPGRFTFGAVLPGRWSLSLRSEGYIPVSVTEFVVTAAGPAAPLEFRLERGVRVAGSVRGPSGEILGEGAVYFAAPGTASVSGRIDTEGLFRVEGLKMGGTYRIKVATTGTGGDARWWLPAGGAAWTVPSASGEVRRDLRLAPAGALVVRVRSARLPSFGVYHEGTEEQKRTSEESRAFLLDRTGSVAWEGPIYGENGFEEIFPVGSYTLRLAVPGAPAVEREVELSPTGVTRVEFEIP